MAARATLTQQEDARQQLLIVHKILCQTYGCPIQFFHDHDPLSELISSLLSHRTRNADSGRAFRQLRQRFSSWEEVRDAPVTEVEAAISACTWPEQKAPNLQRVLHQITQQRGGLSLEFLADLPIEEARNWLENLSGVGPKTSAAVLLFSNLRMPALPVDSHHYRVASRLGFLPAGINQKNAHRWLSELLPPDWNAQEVYDNHEVLMIHGQRCCYFTHPACERCPVAQHCLYWKNLMTEKIKNSEGVLSENLG